MDVLAVSGSTAHDKLSNCERCVRLHANDVEIGVQAAQKWPGWFVPCHLAKGDATARVRDSMDV